MTGLVILQCKPKQVNIGLNTNRRVKLLEPIPQKVISLGKELEANGVKVEFKKYIQKYLIR